MRCRAPHRLVITALTGLVAAALPATTAAAPPTPPLSECAPTVTAGALTPGQQAVGFTVRQGETVESFDVEILGILHNGIAPGRDLIVVDTSGPVIDAGGGGISAGMSGSPVYTLDGDLIGAVSYGFSGGPSSIGGVTPADPDMLSLLGEPKAKAPLRGSARISLHGELRRRAARRGGLSKRALDGGLGRLKVPVALSGGLLPQRVALFRRAIRRQHLPFILTAGGSAPQAKAPIGTVAPGDAFAATFSYGDVSFAGIGTTTYVCDDQALAFGHPLAFTGPTLLGANRASVLSVVDDSVYGPFKLAEATDPVGLVDLDRLPAIRAELGTLPTTIPITQNTTALDTGSRSPTARRTSSTPATPWTACFPTSPSFTP